MDGFTPVENDAIEWLIRGSTATNALRLASTLWAAGVASVATPWGWRMWRLWGRSGWQYRSPAWGLRALANRMTLNQFDALQRCTALRSALGRQALAAVPAPRPTEGPCGPAQP